MHPSAVDALTTILEVTGLTGDVCCRASASGTWGFRVDPGPRVYFHIIAGGGCCLRTTHQTLALDAGDLVIMPHGTGHALVSDPDASTVSLAEWHARHHLDPVAGSPDAGDHDVDGATTRLLCRTFVFTHSEPHPMLRQLPEVLHIGQHTRGADAVRGILAALISEFDFREMGASAVITRLLDVLFIQTLRYWVKDHGSQAEWLDALRDRAISDSLTLLHSDIGRKWTLAELARRVGVSRAVLSRRFRERLGEPPLHYLTRVRIDTAAVMLRGGQHGMAEIATAVGYESESALSRAFKRVRGVSPRSYRLHANQRALSA